MSSTPVYIGDTPLKDKSKEIQGGFVEMEGEQFYKIANYQQMPDFFISVINSSDHWMFLSSNGALSAGRKNRDNALFPYYTEDKIHDYRGLTGNYSAFLAEQEGKWHYWEPFSKLSEEIYSIDRNIYKNFLGNKLVFEEINHELKIRFRYTWTTSETFGFVKYSEVQNLADQNRTIKVLDGIRNLLPAGIDYSFQNTFSNLLDAYKKNELLEQSQLGLFTLSAVPVDRAEPSESLSATTVWHKGLPSCQVLISDNQLPNFRKGEELATERDIRARRGAYYVHASIELEAQQKQRWIIVAEINQDSADVANLDARLQKEQNLMTLVELDIEQTSEKLKTIASKADGMQMTNTPLCYARHYSNTMYNVMRGGIFAQQYKVDTDDFRRYVNQINKLLFREFHPWLEQLPSHLSYNELIRQVEEKENQDLLRITYEYLPLTFSRRHGDPSRPWNVFSIETKTGDGDLKYDYQGNWRDIFQNWEALSYSFPEFVEGMICKFLNASTFDGYNPYRIMRKGIDWEVPDPKDPWAYIGYWGDHQIIYLQKLLEVSDRFHPQKIADLSDKEIFTYANIPYRIKSFEEIVKNPKSTIEFDHALNKQIESEESYLGADAKLLKTSGKEEILKVNLTEKILVTLLAKMSNFVPEAGIWLNTQRPEWNDANNALVGNGTSMVTVYYLRRFLTFWKTKLEESKATEVLFSENVATLFTSILGHLREFQKYLETGFTDAKRYAMTEKLGQTHARYRTEVYHYAFSGEKKPIKTKSLQVFVELCLAYIDETIRQNKRDDGLYHAYNLISIKDGKIAIRHLYEMLEGQVALLSAGILTTEENLQILDALKASDMFRPDQYSYMLYPDRELPRFTEKNRIPADAVKKSSLLSRLIQDNETSVIRTDDNNNAYFNKTCRNADLLEQQLDQLRTQGYNKLVEDEKQLVLDIYEALFDHQSFTGRSGTFFGYEGLGCIYWHMVSKLLLATQECYFKALNEKADDKTLGRLKNHYYEIKAGIGLYKSPDLYGAFPTDAYSHTPGNAGVKQPGLTGQVKEDVISRLGEMGLLIKDGCLHFNPALMNKEEVLTHAEDFQFYNLQEELELHALSSGEMALTFCQVPIIWHQSNKQEIQILQDNGKTEIQTGQSLGKEFSQQIFTRSGKIKRIDVFTKNLGHE